MNAMTAPFYLPNKDEVEVFEFSYKNKLSILLKGPTGAGKSRFVEFMASRLELPLITVSCHEETSAVDLTGRYIVSGLETVWQDGPLTRAVRQGAILYLDEIAEARPDVIVVLHSLTDHRRELFIDKHNEVIKAPDHFMLVASFNPGYAGVKDLKPSTRQRFVTLAFQYPEPSIEVRILMAETGIDKERATKLVKFAGKIRNAPELNLEETVSTRLLVNAAHLMREGLSEFAAIRSAVSDVLTDDLEIATALRDAGALIF